MNKEKILANIVSLLDQKLENTIKAANIAYADATADESRAENKYDTRGLEASYLAGAQSKMAVESKLNLAIYKKLKLQSFDKNSKIKLTALIELESEDGVRRFYFLGPNSGGTEITCEGTTIFIITIPSPMGQKMINRECGDIIEVPAGNGIKEYEIVAIY